MSLLSAHSNQKQAAYPDSVPLSDGGFALSSPAKINLGLRVLGKRPDGYHELETVFQEISLSDLIEFHPSETWSLEVIGAQLDSGESNLITRAARLLSARANVPCAVRLVLQKVIPLGGGLGGGSSNAAVALLGLNRLWKLDWPLQALHGIAAELGSDCSFFLHGGLAIGRGRGENLELLSTCFSGSVLLVCPPFSVSTSWVFGEGRFPLTNAEKNVIFTSPTANIKADDRLPAVLSNDLENIVFQKHGELRDVKEALLKQGAEVSMLSGSGSTVYGIFKDQPHAVHAAQQFGAPYHVRLCSCVCRLRSQA